MANRHRSFEIVIPITTCKYVKVNAPENWSSEQIAEYVWDNQGTLPLELQEPMTCDYNLDAVEVYECDEFDSDAHPVPQGSNNVLA
jgi:hypothetical protein